MIKKAVVPAAGWGTRFLPITKAVPKEMLPIIDKPALSYIIEEAVASGIEEILIIISSNKGAIQSYFEHNVELEQFLKEKINLMILNSSKIQVMVQKYFTQHKKNN
nr:sugar phosphate nucleotidyltransferase [Acholeplasma laidlawii]